MHQAVQIMDNAVIHTRLNNQQRKLWEIQRDRLNEIHENGGTGKKKKKASVHPVLISWDINFLACTPISVYKEVHTVMKLPYLRHV